MSASRIGRTEVARLVALDRVDYTERPDKLAGALGVVVQLIATHVRTCQSCAFGIPGRSLGIRCTNLDMMLAALSRYQRLLPSEPAPRQLVLDQLTIDPGHPAAEPTREDTLI